MINKAPLEGLERMGEELTKRIYKSGVITVDVRENLV